MRGAHELVSHGLTEALRAVLADGEWHDIDGLVARLGDRIPPEIASRRWLAGRNPRSTSPASRWPTAPAAIRQALTKGRRYVVVATLQALARPRHHSLRLVYERGARRQVQRVRLDPDGPAVARPAPGVPEMVVGIFGAAPGGDNAEPGCRR